MIWLLTPRALTGKSSQAVNWIVCHSRTGQSSVCLWEQNTQAHAPLKGERQDALIHFIYLTEISNSPNAQWRQYIMCQLYKLLISFPAKPAKSFLEALKFIYKKNTQCANKTWMLSHSWNLLFFNLTNFHYMQMDNREVCCVLFLCLWSKCATSEVWFHTHGNHWQS